MFHSWIKFEMAPIAAPSATATTLLTHAFATAPGSKQDQHTKVNVTEALKIYQLSFTKRKLLAKGPLVRIVDAEDNHVINMPIPLFRATSIKEQQLLATGSNTIKLLVGLDVQMVKDLVQHLKDVTTCNPHAKDIRSYKSTYRDIQICSAADTLGMTLYTQHIFNWYWAHLGTCQLPGYDDIDAFTAIETPIGDNIFRKAVTLMAKLDLEGRIPDPEDYAAYLATNERFRIAVTEAKNRKQRHLHWVTRQARREQADAFQGSAHDQNSKERAKYPKEKAVKEQAKWGSNKKNEAAVRAPVTGKRAKGLDGFAWRICGVNLVV
ncbi:hypothetical protein EJ02DRAFT_446727 [Clathrospora elynae]|uniref:Uncharacterized protein n=1 Tax=Clathrospora elynae TaxID=706981 RepID=A0A6A5SGN7_9PLEO|nr:hypothetical protein EJ02DRAFT_446727 [Clathrospora elynae]